jgi:hypothetical protein
MTITDLIDLAHQYARARAKLIGRCAIIQRAINALKRNNLPLLTRYSADLTACHQALAAAIEQNRALFIKPRTVEVEEIKFGLRKKKGTMDWKDDAGLVAKLKDTRDDWPSLIRIKEVPDAAALAKLPADVLRKLGVTLTADSDEVTITTPPSKTEKLAAAFLQTEESQPEAKR